MLTGSFLVGEFTYLFSFILVCNSVTKRRMPPIKVCPECCSVVNYKKCVCELVWRATPLKGVARQTICECGHCFTLSRKRSNDAPSQRKSKRIAMQSKRASESACETTLRQTKVNVT